MSKQAIDGVQGCAEYDVEAIEADYRAGQMSNVALGKKHGVSRTTISRLASKYAWKKDLTGAVIATTRALLVEGDAQRQDGQCAEAHAREAVDAAAAANVLVIREHRKDIAAARGVAHNLMDQLVDDDGRVMDLIESIRKEDPKGAARLMAENSLKAKSEVLRNLSSAMNSLISLERKAHNLDDSEANESQYEKHLVALSEMEPNLT